MAKAAAGEIRLGVIGLGRVWDSRHRPALGRLRDRFEVTALCDEVTRRAEIEAKHLDCRAMTGLIALVNSPDVDAIAWLAPQWFGTHPISLARRAGKPIYCGVPLPDDPTPLDQIAATLTIGQGEARIFWPAEILYPTSPLDPTEAIAISEATLRRFHQMIHDPTTTAAPWNEVLATAQAVIAAQRERLAGREP